MMDKDYKEYSQYIIDNFVGFNLNFDSLGEIIVIINGKTIKIDKQKLEQLLLTLGVEVSENE